jgi:hypothetical protein
MDEIILTQHYNEIIIKYLDMQDWINFHTITRNIWNNRNLYIYYEFRTKTTIARMKGGNNIAIDNNIGIAGGNNIAIGNNIGIAGGNNIVIGNNTGPMGSPGIAGPMGPLGITGPMGALGITGPIGPTGSSGITVAQGPPNYSLKCLYKIIESKDVRWLHYFLKYHRAEIGDREYINVQAFNKNPILEKELLFWK